MSERRCLPMQEKIMRYKYYLLGATVLLIIFTYQLWSNQQQEEASIFIEEPEEETATVEEISVEETEVMVDVKGAVKETGVYQLQKGQRVQDAILKAGGFLENADEKQINLAQLLEDEMVIYVPVIGEEGFEGIASSQEQAQEGKVNINTATSEELQTISGIGPSKAEAIVRYREENGLFQKIEDITNVSGIGEKTFENLRDKISV